VKVKNLQLQNFRNHLNLSLDTNSDIVYIYGNNGLGKTNILEAVFLISTSKSLRSEFDKDLINHHKNFLRVKGYIEDLEEKKELEITIEKRNDYQNTSNKKTYINGVTKSLTNFAGTIKSVIFSPNDLEILTASPGNRRKYLDSIFYQFNSTYKNSILEYTKSLKQRNKLLQIISETGKSRDQLPFWNLKLIQEGNKIQQEREKFFEYANLHKNQIILDLQIKNFSLEFLYKKSEISEERLQKYSSAELASQTTLVGPHKDDFEIILNGYKISDFGSRGQQRMGIFILKKLELNFLFEKTKVRPILLLDDIFSELDDNNRNAILKIIPNQQTFITSVDLIKDFNIPTSKTYQIGDLITF